MEPTDTAVSYNPFEPGFTDNPYPQYELLRAEEPVHLNPLGFWMLFTYEDVVRFLRDPAMSVEDRHAHTTPLTEFVDEVLGADRTTQEGDLSMLNRDAPDHTRLRRLVSKAFTPRTIELLRPRVQEMVDDALADAEARGGMELIGDYAFPLPFAVISEMMGMPPGDALHLRELSGLIVSSLEPVIDADLLRAIDGAAEEMRDLIVAAIEDKRQHPADDLMSALIAAEDGGDTLSEDELAQQVALLYIAGHETTVNLIGNGMLALLHHPEQMQALREDPSLLPNAVDELLRYDAPVQNTRRITLQDVEVRGRVIEAGAFVALSQASANRDPAHFGESAGRLDLRRADASTHVSFGGGHHYCLGAALAKLEAQVAIGSLLQRFGTIEAVADPIWNGRINLRGLDSLPLLLRS